MALDMIPVSLKRLHRAMRHLEADCGSCEHCGNCEAARGLWLAIVDACLDHNKAFLDSISGEHEEAIVNGGGS